MKKTNAKITQSQVEQVFGWRFWLWLALFMSVMLIVAVIGTAWAVRIAMVAGPRLSFEQSRLFIAIAEFPELVSGAIREVQTHFNNDPVLLLLDRKSVEQSQWIRSFPAPADPGYLLFSGVDPTAKHSIVQLIRISDGAQIARWDPDWPEIYQHITSKKFAPVGSPNAAQAVHPLLLADGDIIFNTVSSLVRLTPCSSKPVWVLDEVMHHSIERDVTDDIWVPSISQDGFVDNSWLRDQIRDDALARVSIDGQVLDKRSFVRILRDNGLHAMLLGSFGNVFNVDPIHMNQIQVAPHDSKYWQRGDLLISSRNLSTIFLYRPSTGRILWYKTGPWMNQHSADFVDDHRISVFDNNIVSAAPSEHAFLTPGDTNRVILYDFETQQLSQPFATLLAAARPLTIAQGRARLLPDGGLFLEETQQGRLLRFTRDRLLWSRVNDYDSQHIGAVAWSRYLTAEEASAPMQALASRKCLAGSSVVR
jgi:hypothetical protein